MDELSLVEASQEGDKTAFSSLIDSYYKNVYRLAYQYTGNHHEADDVCQEVFLRAYGSMRDLRDGHCFKAWVLSIASNLLRKRLKEAKRRGQLDVESPVGTTVKIGEDKSMGPFEALSAKEKATIIQNQLQKMPERMRLVTVLVLMEGLPQKDAAGILNCSEASVSRRLEMAREWLRVKLQNLV